MEGQIELGTILRKISRWSLFISIAVSAISLAAWIAGSPMLTSFSAKYIPIAPSTAIVFIGMGVSFLYYICRPNRLAGRLIAAAGASVSMALCFTLIIGFFYGASFQLEHLGLYSGTELSSGIGHMSLITAINFILASFGILSLTLPRSGTHYKNAAAFLGLLVALAGFVVALGYVYETPLLYGGSIIPVALPSSIAFIFLGLSIVTASGPFAIPVAIFTGPSVRSRLMKYFLPAIVVFLLIQDLFFKKILQTSGNPALFSAVTTIFSVIALIFVIERLSTKIGGEIDRAAEERKRAEESLRLNKDRLESLLKLSHIEAKVEKDIIDFALEEVVRLTKSKGGYLHFFNEDEQTIQLNSWSKDVMRNCIAAENEHYPLVQAGVWADSVRFRRPVIHNSYHDIPGKKGYPEGHFHLARHLGVPIFDGERIVGVTGVGNKEEPYNDTDALQIQLFMNSMWSILKQKRMSDEREKMIAELQAAISKVKQLSGLLPICAACKKIRDDKGSWSQIEVYIKSRSEAEFSHGICPDCAKKAYEEFDKMIKSKGPKL
jgi:hypothetical protein